MIDPKYSTLQGLFADRVFRIPHYQRFYSWKKKQREDLFSDLRKLIQTTDGNLPELDLRSRSLRHTQSVLVGSKLASVIWMKRSLSCQHHLGRSTLEDCMKALLLFLCFATSSLAAQNSKLTPLLSKDLAANPEKETTMVTVEYAPGASDPIHRHNAQVFVYVLEGSVVMQVRAGKQLTLGAGQTFYEAPNDVHVVGRDASRTKNAKVLVFLVKAKGTPLLIPAN